MSEMISIQRKKPKASQTSFDSLRSEAIQHAQTISGVIWTDFNLHDPGITILEQLIYAITELDYRTEFDVEDYLSDRNSNIDYDAQALYSPAEIFPTRPVTVLDYRKIFLNSIKEIDNIWMVPVSDQDKNRAYNGLYDVTVKFQLEVDQLAQLHVLAKIKDIYYHSRNLCEDLASIRIVENIEYELCASVEVYDTYDPVDILANIYFKCSQHIAGSVTVTKLDNLDDSIGSLDELFSGPLTPNGFFSDSDFMDNQCEFYVSVLFSTINMLDGVDFIKQLHLERNGECFYDTIRLDDGNKSFDLSTPSLGREIKVVLTKNGRILPVSVEEVRVKLDEINFVYRSSRSRAQDVSLLYELPEGESRAFDAYYSVQNQFPSIYGINAYGVPESASNAEKAKARQLKSYIILFEQYLVNYLANLDSIKRLYSVDLHDQRSYAYQLLDKKQVNDLESVYPANADTKISEVIAKFDNYYDRKNRLIDYLLAIYGETLDQQALRQFNFYDNTKQIEDAVLKTKIHYLTSLVGIGKERAAGVDYTKTDWPQCARTGLHLSVGLLLGFEVQDARSLTMAILKQGFKLTRHREYEHLQSGSFELKFIETDYVNQTFNKVPEILIADNPSLEEIRTNVGEVFQLNNNVLSEALLIDGIYLHKYRVGSLTDNQDYQLTIEFGESQHWYIGTYPDELSAYLAANYLRYFLIKLSKDSEGFHVIEHILLRPEGCRSISGMSFLPHDDFYSLKTSVVFPKWTARCNNRQFQRLAEETVEQRMPAHIQPEFYWFDFQDMYEFETYYECWMEKKSQDDGIEKELDDSARNLIMFLFEHRNLSNQRVDH